MPERRYSKPEPIVEDVVAAPDQEEVEQQGALEALTKIEATGYSKAENVLLPNAFIVVFSNGEVREKRYFQWMMHHCV